METVQTGSKADIQTRLNEAEVYRSMGLLGESLAIYERLLSRPFDLGPNVLEDIQDRVRWLKGELAEEEQGEGKSLSQKDIALIRDALSKEEGKGSVLDSASAFQELGLYSEALGEYAKILSSEYPFEELVPSIAECLLRIQPQSAILEQLETMLGSGRIGTARINALKKLLSLEVERRGLKDLAVEVLGLMVGGGEGLDPGKGRLENKGLEAPSTSRYEGLVRNGHLSAASLQDALRRARGGQKSVEAVLMDDFGIRKEMIGKALSSHYRVPFRAYGEGPGFPKALTGGLKKAFLRGERWVPYRKDGAGIEILMEDPGNLAKTDQIRAIFKQEKIRLCVGIREDIEMLIEDLFDDTLPAPQSQNRSPTPVLERPAETPGRAKEVRRGRRTVASPLDLLSVEFKLGNGPEERICRLAVANYSRHGLGLLVTERDFGILGRIKVGDTLQDMLFFASWAVIRADATVRHKTVLEDGPDKGAYLIGLESSEDFERGSAQTASPAHEIDATP